MTLTRRNLILTALATTGAAGLPLRATAQGSKLRVVATTGMIADAARRIGGDGVELRALMGAGVDPHAYRQTRTDVLAMTRADLVLWHGLFLEAQMERFLLDLGRKRRVVAVGETIDPDQLIAHGDYADKFDPHIWMDPTLWRQAVQAITQALQAARPKMAAQFGQNAATYLAEIDALAAYGADRMATVPVAQRVLVTAHDAFGYFGRAFGLEVLGIQGISTESEAGLARIRTLVDVLVQRDIRAVFVESSVSDRNIRALIEGAAAQGHEVRIGGELYSDAMGPAGSYEGTYPGMFDHNVTTICRALGGEAPTKGMVGKLMLGS